MLEPEPDISLFFSTLYCRTVGDGHLGQLLPPLWELLTNGWERHERSMLSVGGGDDDDDCSGDGDGVGGADDDDGE